MGTYVHTHLLLRRGRERGDQYDGSLQMKSVMQDMEKVRVSYTSFLPAGYVE